MQAPAPQTPRRSHHCAVVAGPQIPKRIFNPNLRLRRKGHACRRRARRLRCDRQPAGCRRTDCDIGRGRAGQTAAAELNRDVGRHRVRQIRETGQAIDRCGRYRSLQRSGPAASRRRHHRAVVRADQIAQRVFDAHHRLLDKCQPRSGGAGGLRLNREPAGGRAADHKCAADGVGKISAAGRQLLGPSCVDPQVCENGRAVACIGADVQRGSSLQRASPTRQRKGNRPIGGKPNRRVIAKLVLRIDHRLYPKN